MLYNNIHDDDPICGHHEEADDGHHEARRGAPGLADTTFGYTNIYIYIYMCIYIILYNMYLYIYTHIIVYVYVYSCVLLCVYCVVCLLLSCWPGRRSLWSTPQRARRPPWRARCSCLYVIILFIVLQT